MASPSARAPGVRNPLIRQNSDEQIMFAPCLDNARKCFLVLKCIYLPLLLVYGGIMAVLNVMWLLGRTSNFSNTSLYTMCVNAFIISIPTVLVPPLVRLRFIPTAVRLAIANLLFLAICLLVPVVTAHRMWRRKYLELNGLLLLHEYIPSAPPRVRPSAVMPYEPLSVCDDEMFLMLFVFDHASMTLSKFVLWNFIELPRNFFFIGFSLHVFHFWASAYRVTDIHANTCVGRVKLGPGFPDADIVRNQMQPVLHIIHMTCVVLYLLTKIFIVSRDKKENQLWVKSMIEEAVSCTKVHVQALLRISGSSTQQPPQRTAFFWSRTELIQPLVEENTPLILPATIGSALKICASLNDWAIYVGALGVPIQFSFFEIMRLFIRVDGNVRSANYSFLLKCTLLSGLMALPHAIFSKAILRRRIGAPWIVFLSCVLIAILGEQMLRPGFFGNAFLTKNVRFFSCFIIMIVMPSSIMRAFSRYASTSLVFLAFGTQMGYVPSCSNHASPRTVHYSRCDLKCNLIL
jgi:hypothetical protein